MDKPQSPTEWLDDHLRRGNMEAIEALMIEHPLLLQTHATVTGDTPLHLMVEYGITGRCQWLMDRGVGIETRNKDGMTPLHCAANMDDGEMVDFLLGKGADIEARDNSGMTPLLYACSMGCEMAVEHLLRAGANADAVSKNGLSMLGCFLAGGPYHDWDQACSLAELLGQHYRDPARVQSANDEAQRVMATNPRYSAGFQNLIAEINAAYLQQHSTHAVAAQRKSRL